MKRAIFTLSIILSLITHVFGQSPITLTFETLKLHSVDKTPSDIGKREIDTTGTIQILITNIDDSSRVKKLKEVKFFPKGDENALSVDDPVLSVDSTKITFTLTGLNVSLNTSTAKEFEIKGSFETDTSRLLATFSLIKPKKPSSSADTPTNSTTNTIVADYLSKIKELFGDFVEDRIYKEGNIKHLFVGFINDNLQRIPGTVFPDCNESSFVYIVHYLSTNKTEKVSFRGRQNKGPDDLRVLNGTGAQNSSSDSVKIFSFTSEPIGPFDLGTDIVVSVQGKKEGIFTIPACSLPYHVSITGGFFASSLNNPTDITQPGGAGTTLYANNATSQKALTVMAIFYPRPRDPFYKYKELDFWQKWGFSFGTKLSQNLFDDLFLGLNYEFAKAGNFTAGVHYGQHTVIQGYNKFRFGEDLFTAPNPNSSSPAPVFSNSNTNQRWDFGLFIGVSLDLRVINAIRGNSQDQTRRNNQNNN